MLHAAAACEVLFDHELCHLYHGQGRPRSPAPARLSRRLWGERLATSVSQRMNPAASELAVLLDDRCIASRPTHCARWWPAGREGEPSGATCES